jgi:hypothetical protein
MKMNFNISHNFICLQQFIQNRLEATKSVDASNAQSVNWRWTIKACLPNPPWHEYIADWVDYIINHDAISNDIMWPSELKYASRSNA